MLHSAKEVFFLLCVSKGDLFPVVCKDETQI